MLCKTCEDKGLVLKTLAHRQKDGSVTMTLEPDNCDCCGGWSYDGIPCENCNTGRKVVEWVSDEQYPAALEAYKKATGRG
jgi:hypothetical protein